MGKLEHVIVVSLENRSFDHMLGYVKSPAYPLDGLDGQESNPRSALVETHPDFERVSSARVSRSMAMMLANSGEESTNTADATFEATNRWLAELAASNRSSSVP